MSILGIELNDHAITGFSSDRILFAEPGAALLDANNMIFGDAAQAAARTTPSAYHDRYWRDLSEQPLTRPVQAVDSYADLAFGQLQHLWAAHGKGISAVLCAVPAYWDKAQLALLLGIAQEVGIPLVGLTTIPVAATRRHYPDYELIHIELSANATSLMRMLQAEGATAQGDVDTLNDLGVTALDRTCAEYFARRFLESSRFDPMHDALSEQSVYDQLPDWLALLAQNPECELRFTYKGNEFTARVSRLDLEERLRQRCQPLLQRLRARLDTNRPTALQINAAVTLFPGVAEAIADLPGCDVFVLEAAAAARGLVQRSDSIAKSLGALSVTESLPWDQLPADVSLQRAMSSSSGGVPSHVVLGGKAWRLDAQPLRIGAEAADGDYNLLIASRHAGVSRRHCSIELADGQAILTDHSRFGTRLNGHKIAGAAVLQPGDMVSIGDPSCELQVIAEVTSAETA